jgi:hypothetical protein
VDVLDLPKLAEVFTNDPDFEVRFFKSLALLLSQRPGLYLDALSKATSWYYFNLSTRRKEETEERSGQ